MSSPWESGTITRDSRKYIFVLIFDTVIGGGIRLLFVVLSNGSAKTDSANVLLYKRYSPVSVVESSLFAVGWRWERNKFNIHFSRVGNNANAYQSKDKIICFANRLGTESAYIKTIFLQHSTVVKIITFCKMIKK